MVLHCRSKYSAYVDAKYSNPIDMMGSQVWEGVFGVILVIAGSPMHRDTIVEQKAHKMFTHRVGYDLRLQ